MSRKSLIFVFFFFFSLCLAKEAMAQDFVYEPKNPAFGGNTFNYQWMQSSAAAQDKLKDPNAASSSNASKRDPLNEFQENLNRQILSQISRQIVVSQFGEGALAPGEYMVGNYQIVVSEGSNGINIVITDTRNGSETTVTVPYY